MGDGRATPEPKVSAYPRLQDDACHDLQPATYRSRAKRFKRSTALNSDTPGYVGASEARDASARRGVWERPENRSAPARRAASTARTRWAVRREDVSRRQASLRLDPRAGRRQKDREEPKWTLSGSLGGSECAGEGSRGLCGRLSEKTVVDRFAKRGLTLDVVSS